MIDPKPLTLADGFRAQPVFATFIMLLAIAALASSAYALFKDTTTKPWGEYPHPAVFGELNEDGFVTRTVDEQGRAIIDTENPLMHAVRCGPGEAVEVVSSRFYVIGYNRLTSVRVEGVRSGFLFEPFDSPSGCGIVSFSSVPVSRELVGEEPVEFRLDIADASGKFLTVSMRSEPLVFGDPADGTEDRVRLVVPGE